MGKWTEPCYDGELVRKFKAIFDQLKPKLAAENPDAPYTFEDFVEALDENDRFTQRLVEFLVKETKARRQTAPHRTWYDRIRANERGGEPLTRRRALGDFGLGPLPPPPPARAIIIGGDDSDSEREDAANNTNTNENNTGGGGGGDFAQNLPLAAAPYGVPRRRDLARDPQYARLERLIHIRTIAEERRMQLQRREHENPLHWTFDPPIRLPRRTYYARRGDAITFAQPAAETEAETEAGAEETAAREDGDGLDENGNAVPNAEAEGEPAPDQDPNPDTQELIPFNVPLNVYGVPDAMLPRLAPYTRLAPRMAVPIPARALPEDPATTSTTAAATTSGGVGASENNAAR